MKVKEGLITSSMISIEIGKKVFIDLYADGEHYLELLHGKGSKSKTKDLKLNSKQLRKLSILFNEAALLVEEREVDDKRHDR